jgi:4-hydroxymandelate oxidase
MHSVNELEASAKVLLPTATYDFVAGGAGSEATIEANIAAWSRLLFWPRVLRDVGDIDTSTSVLGQRLRLPVLVAPMGRQSLVHPDGECEMAKGAAASGVGIVVPELASRPVEELAGGLPDASWFQIYLQRDRSITQTLAAKVAAHGYRALVLTVDTPVPGNRLRDVRNDFSCSSLVSANAPADNNNYTEDPYPGVTFDDVAWLSGCTSLPVLVKGVTRPDDAVRCVEAGARGVIVSNHGGRQLDTQMPTANALPLVVDAVGNKALVLVDGGVRCGEDIVKAIALGADAVLIGRPAIWALSTSGAGGVRMLMDWLAENMARTMAQCGVPNITVLTKDLLAEPL